MGSFYAKKSGSADSDGGNVFLESIADINFITGGDMTTAVSTDPQLIITSDGKILISQTTSNWGTTSANSVIQLKNGVVWDYGGVQLDVGHNYYYNSSGAYKYIRGGYAARQTFHNNDGSIAFWSGGTGSADGTFTWSERVRITSGGVLNVPAGIGPQLRFENQHSVTTDAAISTFDDATGTLLCLGSNFYMSSSGAETRYNTSEESAGIVINRNGSMNFLTGGTGATATGRFSIRSDGRVLLDNNDGTFTIGGDNVYDNAKINLMVGSSSQTSATTEVTALVIHDQNSRRNGTEGCLLYTSPSPRD